MMKKNIWLKVAAIVFAVFLWFFVVLREQSTVTVEVPVEFRNIPSGVAVLNAGSYITSLSIKGPERLIRNLSSSSIHVTLDIAGTVKGQRTFSIDRDAIRVPAFLRITGVTPAVKVLLEEVTER